MVHISTWVPLNHEGSWWLSVEETTGTFTEELWSQDGWDLSS